MNTMAEAEYSIQAVSDRCGVNPVTLRAWERRYGLLKPHRTDKGHRRYSESQMARVQAIMQWLEKGVPIRQVGELLDVPGAAPALTQAPVWQQAREQAMVALDSLNLRRLEQQLNGLLADYGHERVLTHFSDPLREQLRVSPSLSLQASLFDSLLGQKWSGRALSRAPGRGRAGWVLVPLGDPLAALEMAMVLDSPLWCLTRAPDFDALQAAYLSGRAFGVLWLAEAMPTAAQRTRWLPRQSPAFPARVWGPLAASLAASGMEVQTLAGTRGDAARQLDAMTITQAQGESS